MTSSLQPWQPLERGEPLERNDRRVQRAKMRLPAGGSEHRVTSLIEESLRLMALPGEDQGRTYYFRRVALRGMPAGAPLGDWIDRTQATMQALAQRAIHGKDHRAAAADAVFFHSHQEALEWLLGRVLHTRSATLESAEWFAPMISNISPGSSPEAQIVAIVERLRSLPAGWFAAATAFFRSLEANPQATSLIASLPERTIQLWLNELGSSHMNGSATPRLSASRRRFLLDRLSTHHCHAAISLNRPSAEAQPSEASSNRSASGHPAQELPLYLVWLAAMAIIADDPGEHARGSATAHARKIVGQLSQLLDHASESEMEIRRAITSRKQLKDEQKFPLSADQAELRGQSAMEDAVLYKKEHLLDLPDAELDPSFDGSLPTDAGGLYFLLNVLRHLGIANAIEQLPPPVRGIFLARLFSSLGQTASVSSDDPALLWCAAQLDADDSALHIAAACCWPRSFFQPPETDHSLTRMVRVWTLAVRRWCWLMGRLTLCEIVRRPGYILLSRTDLDVTLSMDTVDLRLRRLGLDLDPGWLPWFGCVVRFHYTGSHARVGKGGATA